MKWDYWVTAASDRERELQSPQQNFIPRNEAFRCEKCGCQAQPAKGTFRNHCPTCLASKHVDEAVPGDRAAACGGLMLAIDVDGTDPDQLDLIHQCQVCGKIARNRTAPDDDQESVFGLMAGRRQ